MKKYWEARYKNNFANKEVTQISWIDNISAPNQIDFVGEKNIKKKAHNNVYIFSSIMFQRKNI